MQLKNIAGYNHVCFAAHQVAEKALKGGVYALCGMDGRTVTEHNLSRLAYALEAVRPEQAKGLIQHCIPLESYYIDTHPNRCDASLSLYSQEHADKAKSHAKTIFDTVKSTMQKLN